jgi:hypothetical protein
LTAVDLEALGSLGKPVIYSREQMNLTKKNQNTIIKEIWGSDKVALKTVAF